MKINSNYYFWKTVVFALMGLIMIGVSLFYHQFKDLTTVILILALIVYNQYQIEQLKEKLNEPRPPQQD